MLKKMMEFDPSIRFAPAAAQPGEA